ncbi:MAG: Multi-sensor signal transduction histidine kinase [Candidatus Collierbacteria bacterium GW2011_GWF1_44_12]|uniref:histidine kinase n=1 Tax=Candidatus Collierbacteria bacterium GW2011_GWF1_44_12 TaxID=1618402 RepID=A0A0G1GV37_9BACT|nr:MAG: Multi-sensor signal transduction histidine kinase [Candidatus Collierbacteria bacterium GW2011_GWF1_44_12]
MMTDQDSTNEVEDIRRATLNLLADLEEERTALALSMAKNEALLESLGDGILATDKNGVIISVNQAAEKLLNGSQKDFLGKKLSDVLHIYDDKGVLIPQEKHPFQKAFVSGKKVVETFIYERKDGTKFPAAITMTPVIFNGKTVGVIEVFRDVTKELELDKAKDEFISLASHQLKSPITGILWNLELLLEKKSGLKNDQVGVLELIQNSVKGMLNLVAGFLDATKIEAAGFVVERGKVDLAQICDSVIGELAGQISDKKIDIIKDYGKDIPLLDIGIKTGRVIFQNLISNAVKYTQEKGTVEVKIEKSKEGAKISVKDNGYGIPESAKKQIFTKLYRADNVRVKEPLGTGLGLYLVKKLVDNLGGKVWFESKLGVGSTFYVSLK